MAGTSYTRQSTLTDGDTITASLFNDEYNKLVSAFSYTTSGTTGHQHDGGAGEGGNIEIIGDQDFLNKIVVDSSNNRWSVFVEVGGSAVEQVRIEDGVVYPVTDSDVDLGTNALRFKNAYIDSLTATGNLTVGGNITVTGNVDVDGIVEFDGLSGTGSVTVTDILDQDDMSGNSATALATQQSIKAYVDAQQDTVDTFGEVLALSNTTAGTDISVSTDDKVQFRDSAIYINSSADGQLDIVADTEIQIAATTIDINGAINASGEIIAASLDISGNIDVDGTTNLDVVDIDGAVDMATTLAVAGNVDFNGDLDVDGTTNLDVVDIDGAVDMASTLTVASNIVVGGTVDGRDVATDGTKLDGIEASATADQSNAEIRTAVEAATDSNVFTDADHSKLNAVEASADVTDTANVTAAGALMDSEVTNLAQVKAFDSSDYATAAQGTLATNALPKSGGAMTGAITTNSTFDGVDIATRDGVLTTTTNTANAALPKAGGTMTGAIAMGTSKITGAGNPTANQDVATKAYVDTEVAGVVDSAPAALNTLNELAAALGDDANFSTTVTNSIAAKLPKAGGTMTGAIAMGTSKITGMGNPTAAQDAATKAYVDNNSNYSLPVATNSALGGIELFSNTDQSVAANAVTTTASRTYGIQLNSANQAVVNVPWTDTNTTYSVGDGGLSQINFTSADHTKLNGIATSANNYTLPLATNTVRGGIELFNNTDQSVAANSVTTTASRTYGIQLNSANQAVVNVPWTDTNTTYSVGDGGLTQNNFTDADHTKLNGIATGATANVGDITGVTAGTNLNGGGTSGAVTINVDASPSFTNVTASGDMTVGDQIFHAGDTDTYMQFHAADQWRVVTGGAERLEVNNTDVTIAGTLNVRTAIDLADNDVLRFGSGDDAEFFHNGSHLYTDLNTGDWYIRNGTTAEFFFNDNGDFHADGNIFAYSTSTGSDIKLKDNVETIPNALEKLDAITGCTWDWKHNNKEGAGVIAQDLEKVLPSAVSETKDLNSEDTFKTVEYNQVVGLLVQAVKELKAEVEELKGVK